jgi:signal peptidase II
MLSKRPVLETGLRWLWITILFLIVDQLTKHMAVDYFENSAIQRVEVMPFFNFVLAYNKGAAFSFLADQGGWQVHFFSIVSSVVSIGLLYWLYTLSAKNRWLSISLSLILAGALGNLHDRLFVEKGVVDFIDWYYGNYHFPAFNIADAVIFLGAAMMLYDSFMHPQDDSADEKTKDLK